MMINARIETNAKQAVEKLLEPVNFIVSYAGIGEILPLFLGWKP
jgi:hypothetical protein